MYIFSIIIFVLLGWWLSYEFLYSPKAQIKKIQRKRIKIIKEWGSVDPGIFMILIEKENIILNALLDYYFDPENEDDEVYAQENRPEKNLRQLKKEKIIKSLVDKELNKKNLKEEYFFLLYEIGNDFKE